MECNPSRAEGGDIVDADTARQVAPPSVERQAFRSPSEPGGIFVPTMAEMTMAEA